MPQLGQQVWSHPGRGAGRAPSTGQRFSEQHRGCSWPCDSRRVPCTPLCLLCVGPVVSLGRLIPTSGLELRTAAGVSVRFMSEITMETPGQSWEGSRCPSRGVTAAWPSTVVRWAQVALLTPWLSGTAARSQFSRPRLAWMSLIAQRSLSPSPGPRVGGTAGRNLTRTRVIRDQRRGSGNYNGHEPKYAARPPR